MSQYTVTSSGDIISYKGYNTDKPKKLKPIKVNGYLKVNINHNGKEKLLSIHRLVASAFIPNPDEKPEVNHKDGNKLNNDVRNLEWSTSRENIEHALKTGLKKGMKGEGHPAHKVTTDTVVKICELLQEGNHSYAEIADITNSSYSIVKHIKGKRRWKEISMNYDFSKYKRRR